ncbi:MAG: hypothetical protein Greene041619_1065 [Candidatus Peregrinibacteria bacterium Greene0416_19]|nr:MAG: hypothetical protein Greene041619_1065 [Candidatus Peregrinibacteria bacterium Greene0416_19]
MARSKAVPAYERSILAALARGEIEGVERDLGSKLNEKGIQNLPSQLEGHDCGNLEEPLARLIVVTRVVRSVLHGLCSGNLGAVVLLRGRLMHHWSSMMDAPASRMLASTLEAWVDNTRTFLIELAKEKPDLEKAQTSLRDLPGRVRSALGGLLTQRQRQLEAETRQTKRSREDWMALDRRRLQSDTAPYRKVPIAESLAPPSAKRAQPRQPRKARAVPTSHPEPTAAAAPATESAPPTQQDESIDINRNDAPASGMGAPPPAKEETSNAMSVQEYEDLKARLRREGQIL